MQRGFQVGVVSFLAVVVTFASAALRAGDRARRYTPQPPPKSMQASNNVVGNLVNMVDTNVAEYKEEEERWAQMEKSMQKVIKNPKDRESRESAINEKLNMKRSHEKKMDELASMIKSLDDAMGAIRPEKDWKEEFPELKDEVEVIYKAHPGATALVAKKSTVVKKLVAEAQVLDADMEMQMVDDARMRT